MAHTSGYPPELMSDDEDLLIVFESPARSAEVTDGALGRAAAGCLDEVPASHDDDDDLAIVFDSGPVSGDAHSAEGNSRGRERDPDQTDFPRCHICSNCMLCTVQCPHQTAGCSSNNDGIEQRPAERPAENDATDSRGRSIAGEASGMFASLLEAPEDVADAATAIATVRWTDSVSDSSFSHDEDSGLSLSSNGVLGPFPSPGEVPGPSRYPGEASGTSRSPGQVLEAVRPGERDNLSSGAKYFTQYGAAAEGLPFPPPKDDSPIVSMLSFNYGCVTDDCYKKPSTAILVAGNCVSVKPAKGLPTTMVQMFPYADVYSSRVRMPNANRALVQDRPIPGTFTISRSASSPRNPAIVTLFSQFFTGPAFERNLFSQMVVKDIKVRGRPWLKSFAATVDPTVCDLNLYTSLQWDVEANRVQWFKQALEGLIGSLREEGIERVVVPHGIGGCPSGSNWVQDYLVAIEAFEARVRPLGVQVVVVGDIDDETPVPPRRTDNFSRYRPHRAFKPYSRYIT